MRRPPGAGAAPIPGARFVDPRALARISTLELLARNVVDGFISGLHRAPHLGTSLDFAEHRAYMPGDDLRRMDWRLYARTDRFYLKQFEADTNANTSVFVDVSKSMSYGLGGISKLDYARYLAASLLYFSSRQRDRVGLGTFDNQVVDWIPPSARHLDLALLALERAEAGRPGELGPPLRTLGERLRRRGIVVLISDFYEPPETVLEALRKLRYRGHDLVVFHVLDPTEIDFPFEDAQPFEDLESGVRIPVVPEAQRATYRALVEAHVETLQKGCVGHRIDYMLLNTALPLDHALFRYLSVRERMSRKR
jgi:uncharacterized protein (DUF58 family)